MNTDKKPVIGLICVVISCVLVIGITLGLLSSVNNNAAFGSTADTTDNTSDNIPDTTEEPPVDETEPEPELQWGYKFKYANVLVDGAWRGNIAYKSQYSTFNIDEVKLTISFGSFNADRGPNEYDDIPEYDIYFADPLDSIDNSIYTIKTVEKQLFSEEYNITRVNSESENWDYCYEFNHTEEITIPKELFTESEGVIKLVVGGTSFAIKRHGYEILDATSIKYQLIGTNEVKLSPRWGYPWEW